MRKIGTLLLVVFATFCFYGCGNDGDEHKQKLLVKTNRVEGLNFYRYEDVLFTLDTNDFQDGLMKIQGEYAPFLDGDLSNMYAVKYIQDFVTDPFVRVLFGKVKTAFPNLDFVRKTVEEVYAHFAYYYPGVKLPENIYTCVSGISVETPAVMIIDGNLIISLDWYLDGDEIYDSFGMPRYISDRTGKEAMPKDVAKALYAEFIQDWRKQTNLLDEMVAAGKMLYFIEAMSPGIKDAVLMGYTEEQLKWAESYEGDVWADIVGSQRLYSTGLDMHMTFLADGPFTQEYSNEAPSRLGEYIGLHIVRSYMQNNDVALQSLMEDMDFQGIFQQSNYKARKK